ALAAPTDSAYPLGYRVRSYLAANCSQCHQGAKGNPEIESSLWDARFSTPTSLAGIVDGQLFGHFGDSVDHVISPFSPEHSIMLARINRRDTYQMPPLATRLVDANSVALLTEWILTFPPLPWRSLEVGAVAQEGFASVNG